MAKQTPNQNSYGNLALYLYFGGDISGGDKAAAKAQSLAPKLQRKQVAQQLDQIRQQAVTLKKQQAKASKNAPPATTPGANPLQDPLGTAP